MQYQIYWQPQTQLLALQGATVDFRALNEVFYEHYFLPSGHIIARWQSQRHDLNDKPIADLPRLQQGKTYEVIRHIDMSERMFAYLSITFFDEQFQVIKTFSKNAEQLTIEVPDQYHFYTVDLVSAGTGNFVFHDFLLREKMTGVLSENDQEIAPGVYTNLQKPAKIVSKTLRVIFSEPEAAVTDYMTDKIKVTQQGVLFVTSDHLQAGFYRQDSLMAAFKNARRDVHARNIEFVGYGPVSSYAALYYQQIIKGSMAIITDDVQLDPGITGWAITRTIDGVRALGNPIAPNYIARLVVNRPKYERLEMLPYETLTDEELARAAEIAARQPKVNKLAQWFTK